MDAGLVRRQMSHRFAALEIRQDRAGINFKHYACASLAVESQFSELMGFATFDTTCSEFHFCSDIPYDNCVHAMTGRCVVVHHRGTQSSFAQELHGFGRNLLWLYVPNFDIVQQQRFAACDKPIAGFIDVE